jgi:hypothetical protein
MKIDGEIIEFIGQTLLPWVVATLHGITANAKARLHERSERRAEAQS